MFGVFMRCGAAFAAFLAAFGSFLALLIWQQSCSLDHENMKTLTVLAGKPHQRFLTPDWQWRIRA